MNFKFGFLRRERLITDRRIVDLLGKDGTFTAFPTQVSVECKPFSKPLDVQGSI
jgi:hypothetical protein